MSGSIGLVSNRRSSSFEDILSVLFFGVLPIYTASNFQKQPSSSKMCISSKPYLITDIYSRSNNSISISSVCCADSLLKSYDKLNEIAALNANWNDNGASAFSDQLVLRVRSIVTKLQHQPFIFPTAKSSIQLEYENSFGDYLEFEIFEDGNIKMFSYDRNGIEDSVYTTEEEMCDSISKFYQRNY